MTSVHIKLGTLEGTNPVTGYPVECCESESKDLLPGYDLVMTVEEFNVFKDSFSQKYETWREEAELPQRKSDLKARIAAKRWEKESGGIIVGDQPVSTLREEMPVWQGMLLDMSFRPGATTEFEYKPRNGKNVTLNGLQVQRIYECFAWYVAACFATERYLVSLIDTGTPLPEVEAMLEVIWPQTTFTWERPS